MAPQPEKLRVLAMCNYDIKRIYAEWRAEDRNAPSQHIWGIPQLEEKGFEVSICEVRDTFLARLSARIRPLGDLDQQLQILRGLRAHDVIYAAHFPSIPLIAFLRRIGLVRTPIVAIAAQYPVRPKWLARAYAKLGASGCDRLLCLSEATRTGYRDLGVPEARLGRIFWGIDAKYYHPVEKQAADGIRSFIATGKTHRDYASLIEGFPSDQARLTIFGVGAGLPIEVPEEKADSIEMTHAWMPWKEFGDRMAASDAVLVPLAMDTLKVPNAIGLTAVLEAAACGVPVIVTRNAHIGIDVEAEGIGVWVDPGDPSDWRRTLERLCGMPEALQEMGRKGRDLARTRWTMERFADDLAQEILAVVDADGARRPAGSDTPGEEAGEAAPIRSDASAPDASSARPTDHEPSTHQRTPSAAISR